MPTVKVKDEEIEVPVELVARMADRMFRLGGKGRRADYAARAKAKLDAGSKSRMNAAIVLAAGGEIGNG